MVGITKKGVEFYFDKCDFDLVCQYTWHVTSLGYVAHKSKTISLLLHRFILTAPYGSVVDHEDNNPLNNCRSNLRVCTQADNLANTRKPRVKSTSKYKGVHRHTVNDRWIAQISVGNRTKYIGSFINEDEAALAYNRVATEVYGEFAHLNKVG